MSKTKHYTQCKMSNDLNQIHTAWIPSPLAVIGRHIEIKIKDVWGSWVVFEVHGTKTAEIVEARAHKSTQGFGSVGPK